MKSHPLCATLYTVDPSLPLIDILAENDTEQLPNIFRFSQNIKILNPSFAQFTSLLGGSNINKMSLKKFHIPKTQFPTDEHKNRFLEGASAVMLHMSIYLFNDFMSSAR